MKRKSIIHHIALVFLVLLSLPIAYLLLQITHNHEVTLKTTLIIRYAQNTLIMLLCTALCSALLGSSLAWIVSFYSFRFRKLFKVLLALPLAIPPYIAAFGYGDFFYHNGLFHKLTILLGMNQYYDIRNIVGAIFIYTITLYPYVYLICLSYYAGIDCSLIDNARLLKANHFKIFFQIAMPLARVAILSGTMLLMMEVISDFGVVDYYGVQAFSTGIYKIWLNYGDFYGAIRLSAIALFFILILVILEQQLRKNLRYFYQTTKSSHNLIETNVKMKYFIYSYLLIVSTICLVLPILQLAYNSFYLKENLINFYLLETLKNTFIYCLFVGIICSVIALLIASLTNEKQGFIQNVIAKFTTMGYSVPGVIIGLAVMFSFIDLDRLLLPFYRMIGIHDKVLVLSTSIFVLFFAYVVRFLAIAYNNMYAAYKKIQPNVLLASYTLNVPAIKSFLRIELPLLYPSLLISIALVFLEVLKELPITLMLKPYQVETLTSSIYQFNHNEQYAHAAFMSLLIVFVGFIVVTIIIVLKEKQHAKTK